MAVTGDHIKVVIFTWDFSQSMTYSLSRRLKCKARVMIPKEFSFVLDQIIQGGIRLGQTLVPTNSKTRGGRGLSVWKQIMLDNGQQ